MVTARDSLSRSFHSTGSKQHSFRSTWQQKSYRNRPHHHHHHHHHHPTLTNTLNHANNNSSRRKLSNHNKHPNWTEDQWQDEGHHDPSVLSNVRSSFTKQSSSISCNLQYEFSTSFRVVRVDTSPENHEYDARGNEDVVMITADQIKMKHGTTTTNTNTNIGRPKDEINLTEHLALERIHFLFPDEDFGALPSTCIFFISAAFFNGLSYEMQFFAKIQSTFPNSIRKNYTRASTWDAVDFPPYKKSYGSIPNHTWRNKYGIRRV